MKRSTLTTADVPRLHNDRPIAGPAEDRFGVDPFAQTLASSLRGMESPDGTVVALNGPWGSGKSSIVNLIKHHLGDTSRGAEITVLDFACWWFRGEEALALEFFRQLYAGLSPSLGKRFRKALPKLATRVLQAGSTVGAAVDLTGATAGTGTLLSKATSWISYFFGGGDTVEKLHRELVDELSRQQKRFLIIIDDIDRLSPDEALVMFRLVKSVGRLPNIVYLLVFDRELAEKVVAERYPSEGHHYLEKIIQAAFDTPPPRPSDLSQELLHQVGQICGSPPERQMARFMNVFYDVVAPEMRTPRDLVRLVNTLAVIWPALKTAVDEADFVAIETLRVLRPRLYHSLKRHKDRLCGTARDNRGRDEATELDRVFLGSEDTSDHDRLRRALMRLFPRLSSVWSNVHYGADSAEDWARDRLVCSKEHFDSYFRFSIGDDVLPKSELDTVMLRARDTEFIKATFRSAISTIRRNGRTKAMLLLEELNLHAAEIASDAVLPLLSALFEIADELELDSDRAGAFDIGDNRLRLHWLLRRLTLERFDLSQRSQIFASACEFASLGWLVDFADSAYRDYYPREGRPPEAPERCLTTEEDANRLRERALQHIRNAAHSGALAGSRQLPYLLFRWRELAENGEEEVKVWTAEQIRNDRMIAVFAQAFTTHSWSQSLGMAGLADRVAIRNTRAEVSSLDKILDVPAFRGRLERLALDETSDPAIRTFLKAWKKQEHERD
ncbi:KAP family P-loop NTPase fold protein [Bradyrhizobium stylosanthis]|uniref:KAP family P-loop NTPase fold protein n=1 Tax=Bradyrhizobium stylosanthis TaxID=1803665 RepID=UPI0007C44B91|nr:P-loop NTPase fold protein [Bradyrhizobium stylosanthis]